MLAINWAKISHLSKKIDFLINRKR